jgi:ribosomal protein S18 acetylase RimI-like enzyme
MNAIGGPKPAARADRAGGPKNAALAKSKATTALEKDLMRAEPGASTLTFRRMGSDDRRDVFALFSQLVLHDDFRLDSQAAYSGRPPDRAAIEAALGEALTLFVDRPDYGFVFMALENERVVACASVSYAISLSLGKIVAQMQHLVVAEGQRRRGVGDALVAALVAQLRRIEIARLDVEVHVANEAAKQFFAQLGFKPSREERVALVL